MIILGIESTCDETSVGIVKGGTEVISFVVASSAAMHEKYGGIVPEVAAREQVKCMVPVLKEALNGSSFAKIDAIAVAYGPGLIGSLIIGVETAKALALTLNKPLVKVNHLVGHVYANWLARPTDLPKFPAVALVVSGGHTDLVLMKKHGQFTWLGGTLDDAAGEAFDKVSRVLGLGYPGGPEIEKIAAQVGVGSQRKFNLPLPMINSGNFDFSFSGLKTAMVRLSLTLAKKDVPIAAFEFQDAVVKVLTKKTLAAAKKFNTKSIIVGGGVSASAALRDQLLTSSRKNNIVCFFPEKKFSTDNGAMIASAAYFNFIKINPLKLQSDSSLYF